MKTIVPDFYKDFECIAERCRHNCCIGWEIDIDEDTYAHYRTVEGAFGVRLREGIDTSSGQPCFRLGAGERCVFLNERGLCDIISTLGEGALCEICALHPRYRNFFSDRVEMGLGLCCEEVCRLLLTKTDPITLCLWEDDGGEEELCEEEEEFFAVREAMLAILQDRRVSYDERVCRLRDFCGLHSDTRTPAQWAEIYRELERLDPSWEGYLDRLAACRTWVAGGAEAEEIAAEQLAVYFLLRYTPDSLEDGLLAPRVAFALRAVEVIRTLGRGMDLTGWCELCRMYSCEVEYSRENVAELMDRVTV